MTIRKKIIHPLGYQANYGERSGSRIFGKNTKIETYLYCGTLDEDAPAFAIFKGHVSADKIRRIAAILNEEEA
jgi:hypothetical protein